MATVRQRHKSSCAAACLLCASVELGVPELPAMPGVLNWEHAVPATVDDLGIRNSQNRIYRWTSGNKDSNDEPNSWGYSWPVDIAECAEAIGLQARIVVYSTKTVEAMKLLYKDQWRRIQDFTFEQSDETKSNHRLQDNEREIKIMSVWVHLIGPAKVPGSLHTIMVRPDGSVMEPDTGTDYASIELAKARRKKDARHSWSLSMKGSGLSVIVSRAN